MNEVVKPRERPILFSAPMVRAILAGTKTQTRRVIAAHEFVLDGETTGDGVTTGGWEPGPCKYGKPGDRLWVRESFAEVDGAVIYRADEPDEDIAEARRVRRLARELNRDHGVRWKSGRFMPRRASRIVLELADVRVQRLQDISGEDAIAEGITIERCGCEVCRHTAQMCPADCSTAIMEFASLWQAINGKRPGCSWEANPYVWALTFKRLATPEPA